MISASSSGSDAHARSAFRAKAPSLESPQVPSALIGMSRPNAVEGESTAACAPTILAMAKSNAQRCAFHQKANCTAKAATAAHLIIDAHCRARFGGSRFSSGLGRGSSSGRRSGSGSRTSGVQAGASTGGSSFGSGLGGMIILPVCRSDEGFCRPPAAHRFVWQGAVLPAGFCF